MRISLNKAHYPVTVLGPGTRAGLWLQGCSIGCSGCVSQDTWAKDDNLEVPVADLVAWIAELDPLDGITVSGGEPFDQPQALDLLLTLLHGWREQTSRPVDLLVYSGYSFSRLHRLFPKILARADAVITGPYIAARPTNLVWRGSDNQELLSLTELGRDRYQSHVERRASKSALQVAVDSESIWYIGVPLPGDMDRIDQSLQRSGVHQGATSWKS